MPRSPDDWKDCADMLAGRNVSSDVRPDPVEVVADVLLHRLPIDRREALYESAVMDAEVIVAALRSRGLLPEGQNLSINPSCEPVEGEAERLREALKPFAGCNHTETGQPTSEDWWPPMTERIKDWFEWDDFQRARAALSPAPEGDHD